MEQIQIIQCPKCGTITDRKENCTNCDSMLPRVAAVLCNGEDDINTALKHLGFGDNAYVSNSLLEVVEKTKTQSKKHNTLITSYTTIEDISGVSINLYATPDIPVSVAIDYDMRDSIAEQCFERIQSSKIGELFRIKQKENYMHCITVMCDDAKTSAQFVRYILKELFNTNDTALYFATSVVIDGTIYGISTKGKKLVDEKIERAEKEYMNQVLKEQASYIWNIKRESILPSFAQIFGMAAILAVGVYWGEMYSLTTALILLGSVIALSMIVKGVSKSRRINEVKDLETFKTKFCRVKRPDTSSYPKFIEE